MLRTRYLLTGVLLAGAIAIPALASGTARRVVGDCTKSQVRPATIIIACADDNLALTHLHWNDFGGTTAAAAGSYSYNDCTPNCAGGHFHALPVRVVLSNARPCPDKHDDYRRAKVSFTAGRPPGIKSATSAVSLPGCPLAG
jgi:hypothetical protein